MLGRAVGRGILPKGAFQHLFGEEVTQGVLSVAIPCDQFFFADGAGKGMLLVGEKFHKAVEQSRPSRPSLIGIQEQGQSIVRLVLGV